MEWEDYLDEFADDWVLAGKSINTVKPYVYTLRPFDRELTLRGVKSWIADSPSHDTKHRRAKAMRAFGKWAVANDGPPMDWWARIPSVQQEVTPQPTVSEDEYESIRRKVHGRNLLLVELLWCTGCRASELVRLEWQHLNLQERYAVIEVSKTRTPRVVPLSRRAVIAARRHGRREGPLLGCETRTGLTLALSRRGLPSPHAWRRGWAVASLRAGVSQTSVQSAGGWRSGVMVSRYTKAMAGELAMDEFRRRFV